MVDGRLVAVVSHSIDVTRAVFATTGPDRFGTPRTIGWASEGLVVFDAETLDVLQLTVNSVGIQRGSPVEEVHMVLTYGRQKVGDLEYLLPLRSEHRANSSNGYAERGVTVFSGYRKFAAESGIRFDAGERQ